MRPEGRAHQRSPRKPVTSIRIGTSDWLASDFMNDELEMLRLENERLLSYIRACRYRFGDAAVNSAIMEMCPPEPVRQSTSEEKARQFFEAVRRLHSPDSALANNRGLPRRANTAKLNHHEKR